MKTKLFTLTTLALLLLGLAACTEDGKCKLILIEETETEETEGTESQDYTYDEATNTNN